MNINKLQQRLIQIITQSLSTHYGFDPLKDNLPSNCMELKRDRHAESDREADVLDKIYHHVTEATPSGQKIKAAFATAFEGNQIGSVYKSGGGRQNKHDFKISTQGTGTQGTSAAGTSAAGTGTSAAETQSTVELKQSKDKKPIKTYLPPWTSAVQFLNFPADRFAAGHVYTRRFYDNVLDKFNLTLPKPSYEEWAKDAFRQGKPQTPFVQELKRLYSIDDSAFLAARSDFNRTFILTPDQLETLKTEAYAYATAALAAKDYWLQIHGEIDEPDGFHVQWTPKICLPPLSSFTIKQLEGDKDIECELTSSEYIHGTTKSFRTKMRWGYGQGLTNLRVDLK
jgi:hypothetical protein